MAVDGGTEQMRWALQVTADLGSREFRVLIGLLTYRNRDSRTAWPSASTLASRCGMSTSAVERALKALRDGGVIQVVRTRKASAGWGTKEYLFVAQPPSEVTEPTGQPPSEVTEPQPPSEVTEPSIQPPSLLMEPNPQPPSEVMEPVTPPLDPGSVTSAAQVPSEVTDKPLEEPQLHISSLTTTSPVERWTGPTEQNLDWLAGQISLKVEGCEIPLDSITEKMLKARKPQMTEGGWTMAALALLGSWQSKADAESTFRNTPSAGEEKPRVREGEWRPKWPDITALFSEYPHLNKQTVRHDITRSYLDWMSGKGEDPSKLPYGRALAGWKTILKSNYEEAIRSLPGERNPQMTGTE